MEKYMSDGGKGSKPRPFSVDKETFDNNFDKIFGKKEDNTGVTQNEYQDVLRGLPKASSR